MLSSLLTSAIILIHFFTEDIIMDGMKYIQALSTTRTDRCLESYLFDIFLGPSYNQSPPSVKYMTVRKVSKSDIRLF